MRSYWVGRLDPDQAYQFCVGYVRQVDWWVVPLECGYVRTLAVRGRYDYEPHARTIVSIFVVVVIVTPCVFCLLMALVRRYRHRKQYKEPSPTGSSVRRRLDRLRPAESETCVITDTAGRVEVADEAGSWSGSSRRRRAAERTLPRGQGDVDVSPIPLNCLYDLPSTSLSVTTSQTSLISYA